MNGSTDANADAEAEAEAESRPVGSQERRGTRNVAGERGPHADGVPGVVKVVCLFGAISALLTFGAGVYYWWQSPIVHSLGGGVLLLAAAAKAGATYGLWHAREWAWIVAMVVFPAAILAELARLALGDPSATYAVLADLVVLGYVSGRKERYAPDLRILPE